MLNRRNASIAILSAFVMALWLVPQVQAQTPAKADATGTWKWTQSFGGRGRGGGGGGAPASQPAAGAPTSQPGAPGGGGARAGGRGGQPREYTLTLKQDAEKLTGKIVGANFQDPTAADDISAGTIKDGTVTFKIVRDMGGNSITMTYTGKLDGDTIKGTSAIDFGAGGAPGGMTPPAPQDWTATRQKAN